MLAYRITTKQYKNDLSGTGAAINGGRWNDVGSFVLYTGESIEIALLETIVHTPPMLVPNLFVVTIKFPKSILKIEHNTLPKNWFKPNAPKSLLEISYNWLKSGEFLALKVPSSVVHSSNNYILNCAHPKYKEVKIIETKPLYYDPRIAKS